MCTTLFLLKADDLSIPLSSPISVFVLDNSSTTYFVSFRYVTRLISHIIISSITEAPRSEPQERETSKMYSGHMVAQTPADMWSLEPEDDVDVEECRLRPAGPWSILGWKPTCLRACLVRWSLRMKHLSQSGHVNRFSPVCVRKCRVSSSDRENFFAQPDQVHWKGLSPKNTHRGVRNLRVLLFQPLLRKTTSNASEKKPPIGTSTFFSMHVSTDVLATYSVCVWLFTLMSKRWETQIFDSCLSVYCSVWERTYWAGLRLATVRHHVPDVYNCEIRRCVHHVIVALCYMRLF